MIHVDVKHEGNYYRIETSVDGGPWTTQYLVDDAPTVPSGRAGQLEAENLARVFANGCRFAGAEVKTTSHGYAL